MQTVGELKKIIEDVPDDTPIIGGEYDHTYRPLTGTLIVALDEGHDQWSNDYYPEDCNPPEGCKRVMALRFE